MQAISTVQEVELSRKYSHLVLYLSGGMVNETAVKRHRGVKALLGLIHRADARYG